MYTQNDVEFFSPAEVKELHSLKQKRQDLLPKEEKISRLKIQALWIQ